MKKTMRTKMIDLRRKLGDDVEEVEANTFDLDEEAKERIR